MKRVGDAADDDLGCRRTHLTGGRHAVAESLDHNLPDATTEQLLRTIRLDPAIAGTYVVLLSALDFNASYEGTQAIAPDVCILRATTADENDSKTIGPS